MAGRDDGFFLGLMADRRAKSAQAAGASHKRRPLSAAIPLTVLPLAACAGMIALGVDIEAPLASLALASGVWRVSAGDLLLAFGLLMIFGERLRVSGPGPANVALGFIAAAAGAALFAMAPGFAVSALLLLSVLALGQAAAGTIALRRAGP
ncbi:MAG: hypothetical protein KIS81_08425 [Maricaulaceae bacterium]|nr:hypothetical protein [Maricaulaceae bacterium]